MGVVFPVGVDVKASISNGDAMNDVIGLESRWALWYKSCRIPVESNEREVEAVM